MGFPDGFSLCRSLEALRADRQRQVREYTTVVATREMVGQRAVFLSCSMAVQRGLRIDEAMHPLTIMVTACTAKRCSTRTARRLRLVVPWKTASRASSQLSKSGLFANSHSGRGRRNIRRRTASTPTSIPLSTTRAIAKPTSAALASSFDARH